MAKKRVIIMGAAGRDFHNFNMVFRGNPDYQVVAFTATQIPDIDGRVYPAALAGPGYPEGIPILPEDDLAAIIRREHIDEVVFSYSDISHEYVMHRASLVMAEGADFRLLGPEHTMLKSEKPVVAVCAARTGSGKSQTTRRVSDILRAAGKKVAVIRHPMPYGDLVRQEVQRFATYDDLTAQDCTIEEREEYEPHLDRGTLVFAGVDYEKILRAAEKEADVILWDGGNNDFSFIKPDVYITVVDPHRPGHEVTYHPGEVNVRLADTVVVNKVDTAEPANVALVRQHVAEINPGAMVIEAASPIFVEDAASLRGKRVLVIEDGPTLTHGGMTYGAGVVAARRFGAELVDPRPFAVGSIRGVYQKYSHLTDLLPAMGYSHEQVRELEATIAATPCEVVLVATPIDLRRIMKIDKPALRVRYELQEIGTPTLRDALAPVLK